ncbi:hypothetical protein AAH995_28680 [Pseudomonas putida]|uniref:hypothetical protein n=1 Tax=Pseudomonas putida TaxID=303 RepID=UPI00349E8338
MAAAEAAVTAYEKEVGTSTPSLDKAPTGNGDGKVTSTEAKAALDAAKDARFDTTNGVSDKSTGVLAAEAKDAADAAAASKAVVSAVTGGQAAVAAYDSAAAAKTAADAAVEANVAAAAAAAAGLDTALKADGAAIGYDELSTAAGQPLTTTAEILSFLASTASNPVQRAALVTELNKVPTYGAEVVKEGNLELAAAKAVVTLAEATSKLNAIDTDSTTGGLQSTDYIAKSDASKAAAELLAKATAADEKIAVVQTVVDKFASLDKSVADAKEALSKFETENSTKVDFQDITGATMSGDAAKSDVFYFADKASGADKVAISDFGTGDSIVLGSSFTQGTIAGADSNKLEFFLVQGSTGVQVVVEGVEYANASTTVDASGNVTAPEAAVITLTGLSLADIAVNNGVITHV